MIDVHDKPSNSLFDWIGGKKWLTKTLQSEIDKINFHNKEIYIEPFIGGMGSFFALFDTLKQNGFSRFILNDVNETIITTYNLVKEKPLEITNILAKLEEEYDNTILNKDLYKLHKTKDKDQVRILMKDAELYFKDIKQRFNELKRAENKSNSEKLEIVSLFLFLQDHSFNGIYRENKSGDYNTPFNWSPKKYNVDNKAKTIFEFSHFFNSNNIEFRNLDVFELLEEFSHFTSNSFLYLDPPYLNQNEKSENKYNKDHFTLQKQVELLDKLSDFNSFMYSNHFLPLFEEYFSKEKHQFITVGRKNIMTSKKENRKNDILEILGIKDI